MKCHSLSAFGRGEVPAYEIFEFVVDFYCVEGGFPFKSLCDAQCRESGECAQFEHPFGAYHLHNHLQQPSLQQPRAHASVQEAEVGLPLDA